MSDNTAPHSVALANASVLDFTNDGLVDVMRLITRGSAGSELQTGAVKMRPGANLTFPSEPDRFENLYVLRGRLKVTWSRGESEGGEVSVGPDEAFYLAPGCTFRLEPVGDEELFFVNSMTPPTA
jgi:mannose-6-phosphate isomerase-like protein (cupin superfamily)